MAHVAPRIRRYERSLGCGCFLVNPTRDVGLSDLWLADLAILTLGGSWGSKMAAQTLVDAH